MTNSTNKKNFVHPSNKRVNYLYFLVEVHSPFVGHIEAFIVDQAYTGPLSERKQESLANQVNASCHMKASRTGLRYSVRACGSRAFCLEYAREQGFPDML
jgi:hypothetical protein